MSLPARNYPDLVSLVLVSCLLQSLACSSLLLALVSCLIQSLGVSSLSLAIFSCSSLSCSSLSFSSLSSLQSLFLQSLVSLSLVSCSGLSLQCAHELLKGNKGQNRYLSCVFIGKIQVTFRKYVLYPYKVIFEISPLKVGIRSLGWDHRG